MKSIISMLLILFAFSTFTFSQDKALDDLSNLVGGQWEINTQWGDGTKFKQEIIYEWSLNKKILKAKTYGTVNMETREHGLRNEGIRAFDKTNNKIKFWEFDVFGGIVEGEVIIENKNISFNYIDKINGKDYSMSDKWEFVNKDKYIFKVIMKDGENIKELLSAEIVRN